MDPVTAKLAAKLALTVARSKPAKAVIIGLLVLQLGVVTVLGFVGFYAVASVVSASNDTTTLASQLGAGGLCGSPAGLSAAMVDPNRSLSQQQTQNATTIIAVGKQLNLPVRAWEIALMTSLVESNLINLHSGDADSQGLFQQRPSAGWGTPAQITDPVLATKAFFGLAVHTHNPGLVEVRGWQQMAPGDAAQAVQRSAYPGRYAHQQATADALIKRLADVAASADVVETAPVSCDQPALANTVPVSGLAGAAIRAAESQLGVDYAWGGGGFTGPSRGYGRASAYVGFDCSSLMQFAWYQASGGRVRLPRVADTQESSALVSPVAKQDMQPGDLMYFVIPGEAGWGHVGMYIGGGKMIEAPHTGAQVRISDVTHGYYAARVTAVRRMRG